MDGLSDMDAETMDERDRMGPVDPAARLALDPALLARFPAG